MYSIYGIGVLAFGIAMLLRWRLTTSSEWERRQAASVLVGIAVTAALQGIILIDTSGTVTYHNREAALLLGARLAVSVPMTTVVPEIEHWTQSNALEGECRIVHESTDGPVLVHAMAVHDRYGDPLGSVAFLYRPPDDTRLKCLYHLSDRESQVYRHLLTGRTLRAIGERLHITERTVKAHVHSIYKKTETGNRRGRRAARLFEPGGARLNGGKQRRNRATGGGPVPP